MAGPRLPVPCQNLGISLEKGLNDAKKELSQTYTGHSYTSNCHDEL